MRLFIDTNIYLSFIECSEEKFGSLGRLSELMSQDKFSLVFPKVTQEELLRNIDKVWLGYIGTLSQIYPLKKPKLAVSIADNKVAEEVDRLHDKWRQVILKLKKDYLNSVKKWKSEIYVVVKNASNIYENDEIIEKAIKRRWKGSPPYGKGPIGDEIEWETLINLCVDDDMAIITDDPDWKSLVKSKKELHPVLINEWKSKSKKKIMLYTSLGEFIGALTKEKIERKQIEKEKDVTEKVNRFVRQADMTFGTIISTASVSPSDTINYMGPTTTTYTTTTSSSSSYPVNYGGTATTTTTLPYYSSGFGSTGPTSPEDIEKLINKNHNK
ncbi:MAG TPA: PIN domain-containing protein [Patescibacteria group bacterium]|nr:PIN domain-containing protein [Patescibacteria group bacterium]